jgi:hypothetical protein
MGIAEKSINDTYECAKQEIDKCRSGGGGLNEGFPNPGIFGSERREDEQDIRDSLDFIASRMMLRNHQRITRQ